MKLKVLLIQIFVGLSIISTNAQVQITVNPTQEIKKISPYIYGRNNNLSDNPSSPTKLWQLYKDAGLKFLRESGGNNSTKYNWQRKLSSHPDWYNNVYAHDWDYAAKSLQTNMPEAKGMWSFQLLGYVAKTGANNFNDWNYNGSQGWGGYDSNNNWWSGNTWNLCGGGVITDASKKDGYTPGDPNLYLEPWSAESTTGILTHWFGDLGLNQDQFQYWNMDNEPECWNGTHDDIVTTPMPAEDYIQKYVAVATQARTLFPNIKIVGPVFTNEWQWYNWQNGDAVPDPKTGKKYCWAEYFIKRIAEEQARTGLRLLDVLDFHFYPGSDQNGTLQLYRVFYDTSYNFPGANGVHRVNGGWNTGINQEYIFKRATDWLNQYMGANNRVTMGMSEFGSIYSSNPNVVAVSYASLLGTFAQNNVEIFTPWDWNTGEWEVLHLFTHYAGTVAVSSASSQDNVVSAYSSVNDNRDMLSVVLVNRDVTNSQSVNVSLGNVSLPNGTAVSCYQLSNLPSGETFVSNTNNALKKSGATINNSAVALTLPKLSVTVIQISLTAPVSISTACDVSGINSPVGATISGQAITANVANGVTSQVVSITTSPAASWKLYSDAACTTEITNKTMSLSVGANTAYIRVTAEDGVTAKIYTIVVNRAAAIYTITTASSVNGSVLANMNSATEGMTITLTIISDANYELDAISAYKTGSETSVVALTGTGSTRTFTMPAFDVTVTATFKEIFSLSVSPSSLTFAASGEQQTFSIASNTTWAASSSNSWLTVSPISGSYYGTVTVTAEANTDIYQRTATITVNGTGVIPQTIDITQDAAKDISSIGNIRNAPLSAYFVNNVLKVESSHAEIITIYSVLGVQLYSTKKDAGLIEIPISTLRGSIFIIKGSVSGTIKIVK